MNIINDVLKKKKLRHIDAKAVESFINQALKETPDLKGKKLIKEVRKLIHETYGRYDKRKKNKQKRLEELKELLKNKDFNSEDSLNIHKKILKMHVSTGERLKHYNDFYNQLFSITGKPKKILDIACGLNAFSIPWMGFKDFKYIGLELVKEDCDFIDEYLKLINVDHELIQSNLLEEMPEMEEVDIALLLKTIPLLEITSKGLTEKLLKWIPSKWIAVSFSTKQAGFKKPAFTAEKFEKKLKEYKRIVLPNEIILVFKKGSTGQRNLKEFI